MEIYKAENEAPILFMMVGLTGSGKSYTASNISVNRGGHITKPIICSSDELRKELFGNIEEQNRNTELFCELHKRIKKSLEDGKDTIYDATNLIKKRRTNFLKSLNDIPCKKVCIPVMTPFEECLRQNDERERNVKKDVIKDMYLSWSPPHFHEGFNEIYPIYNFGSVLQKKYTSSEFLHNAVNVSHDNSYHRLSIGEHCIKAYEYMCEASEDQILRTAVLLHDEGKIFVKSKPDDNGECHFYRHENCGSYDSMFFSYNYGYNVKEALDVANLIYFHMRPHTAWNSSIKAEERDKKVLGQEMYDNILLLHEADVYAK